MVDFDIQQRKLQRLFLLAVRKSAAQRAHAEKRLERLAFLRSPQLQTLLELPHGFLATHDAVASLPPYHPDDVAHLSVPPVEPGKRQWETSKTGYMNWAISQLIARARDKDKEGVPVEGSESSAVGNIANAAQKIGKAEDVKAALESIGGSLASLPPSQEAMRE